MLNGDAHHSVFEAEGELRIRPLLCVFKDWNARNISQMSLTILYAEDHKVVAEAVKDTLEAEGWRVVLCYDGAVALKRMASEASYSLLIFDNHLPNVNGVELVRYARQLPHRQRTPIIMFSASEAEAEARSAGADVFLRKPDDVGLIVGTVKGLIGR
jgi:CheY-like chemotaxis protein